MTAASPVQLPAVFGMDREVGGTGGLAVHDKFTGEVIAWTGRATYSAVDQAISDAQRAFVEQKLSPHTRAELLRKVADLVEERQDDFVEAMIAEVGLPAIDARADAARAVATLRECAAAIGITTGRMVPIEAAAGQEHRLAFTVRLPLGPTCAITPFNSPLNTVLHKVGPALAVGSPVVLKPSELTPLCSYLIGCAFRDAGLPAGWLHIVFGPGDELSEALTRDDRIGFYSFTGSARVGRLIHSAIGPRPGQFELSSIASTIIAPDGSLDASAPTITSAAFRKAGQVCTSVQVVLVDRSRCRELAEEVAGYATTLQVGDPHDRATTLGPMISETAAAAAEGKVRDAISAGATALLPVRREGPLMWPVVLTDVTDEMAVVATEMFAPVVSFMPYDDFEEAVAQVAAIPSTLSVGLYTNDWRRVLTAVRRLPVGTVQVNDTSSSRVDLMPFGGQALSGFGKEGPRYAMEELTQERLVVWNSERGSMWGSTNDE